MNLSSHIIQCTSGLPRKSLRLSIAVLIGSLCVCAQSADEIIARNIAARGGLEKLRSVQTMQCVSRVESGTMSTTLVETFKRPFKYHSESQMGRWGEHVTSYDGKSGWTASPGVEPTASTDEELEIIGELADMDGLLVDYQQKGSSVTLVGNEEVVGDDTFHLKVTMKNGRVEHVYINAKTFLVSKTVIKKGISTEETFYSGYKEVEGIMVPFYIVEAWSLNRDSSPGPAVKQAPESVGGRRQKVTLETIRFNVPVDDSVFKMSTHHSKSK